MMNKIQRLFFKLFKRKITIKIESLAEEEKAKFLLNELLKAVQKSGKCLANTSEFGSASIWMHRMNTEDAVIVIEQVGKWSISTKPDFKMTQN